MKLIVEMEMPTSCEKCQACDYEQGECLLADDRSTLPHNGKRRSWCPIIGELPEGHGDLIDRDALLLECTEWFDHSKSVDEEDILNAKAVIASERSERGTTAD